MHYIQPPLFFWTLERWVHTPVLLGFTRNTGDAPLLRAPLPDGD